MAQDLIVSFLSSVPSSVLSQFTTPPLTLAVPPAPLGHGRTFYADWLSKVRDGSGNVIPGMFARAGGKGTIGRVAVIGFSNGCDSGVSQVLEANDAQKIDFLGAFDGIHGSFLGGKLLPSTYNKWIAYAMLCASTKDPNGPQMVITHSSIEPTFPSTTETGNLIWDAVTSKIQQDYMSTYFDELDKIVYPGGRIIKSIDTASSGKPMPSWAWQSFDDGWYVRRNANGFSVFGWGDPGVSPMKRINAICRDRFNCTADHIFQAEAVLPAILSTYLVPRWNPECGPTAGIGQDVAIACSRLGRAYGDGPSGPLTNPFPMGVALPTAPVACPYPPPGQVIIGTPGNPCATVIAPIPAPPSGDEVQGEDEGFATKLLAGAAGVALGFVGARKILKYWKAA